MITIGYKAIIADPCVYVKRIDIQWIPTDKQQADLLTKALDTKQFSKLRDQLITKFYT